ncbi:MAG: polyphosphate kinase [Balneolaceae bacterium]|nr:MAG: polyphosphate kinase [Balneolaceae bacterium]
MSEPFKSLSLYSANPPENLTKGDLKREISTLSDQLAETQRKLHAQKKYALLIVLQGMDASGKDGAVRNVFSRVNPAGCRVTSFKVPTALEMKHDFLWRVHQVCPEWGMIKVFNRSHYEDVLVPTVEGYATPEQIDQRIESINCFEKLLVNNRTILMKFYLHISEEEQIERIRRRKLQPNKRWKYEASDVRATQQRKQYLEVYERLFRECNAEPWQIVPSDKKWYRNYFILKAITDKLSRYDIDYPEIEMHSLKGGDL